MLRYFATMALLLIAGPANAATFAFNASGAIGSLYSAYDGFPQIPNPPSAIGPGDRVSVSFAFDTDGVVPDISMNNDPTVNYYTAMVSDFAMTIGSFSISSALDEKNPAYFQFWNGYQLIGDVDGFAVNVGKSISKYQSPVDYGLGDVDIFLNFAALDLSHSVRSSVDISEQHPLSRYDILIASIVLRPKESTLFTSASIVDLSASLAPTTAVPEPATWLMVITGFGLIGAMMRNRAVGINCPNIGVS